MKRARAIGQDLAAVYAGLGDKDQAFAWLEKDFQTRSGLLGWIEMDTSLRSRSAQTRASPIFFGRMGFTVKIDRISSPS